MLVRKPTREIRSWSTDSRRWSHYRPRPDDIIIATSAKCGTTWMQQIVSLLIFQSPEPRELHEVSPWIDMRFRPLEAMLATIAAQTHRRFLKSHLPYDAMPIFDEVKYIHVARDGRDCFMSWHNHSLHYAPGAVEAQSACGLADETIGRSLPRPAESPHAHFRTWMTEGAEAYRVDDFPADRFFVTERSWWSERRQPNVLMVHFNDLKADLSGEMKRIANFLGIAVDERIWPSLVDAAIFDSMRRNGAALMPRSAMAWDKGHERFLNKGTNGRWHEELTADDTAAYEARAAREFSPGLARWMEKGRLAAGDPRTSPD